MNRHVVGTLIGLAALAGMMVWPLPWPVKAPAVLQPVESVALYAPTPAQIVGLLQPKGAMVTAGTPLMVLSSPELVYEEERTRRRIVALTALIEQDSALPDSADRVGVMREELRTAQTMATGLAALRERLTVTAPVDGRLIDLADPLRPGQWVRPEQALGRVASAGNRRVTAFIAADDLARAEQGATARFIPDDPAAPAIPLRLESIASANADVLDLPYLSAAHGGPVPTTPLKAPKGSAKEKPAVPVYRAVLKPVAAGEPSGLPPQTMAGRVFIDATPLSLVERGWQAAAAAVIRESGF